MRFIFFSIFVLNLQFTYGQQFLKGIIKDNITKEPISYVNIRILNKSNNTVAKSNGEFLLELPKDFKNDTILISTIGYEKKLFMAYDLINELKQTQTILLSPSVTELKEIVIPNRNFKSKILGNEFDGKGIQLYMSHSRIEGKNEERIGREVAVKIKIKKSPTIIETFNTNLTSNTGNMKFRLNFYDIKDGLPNEKIINKNIIFSIKVKEGQFSIDLVPYNIVVSDDFYVGLELIELDEKNDNEITFSGGLFGSPSVFRGSMDLNWEDYSPVNIGFNLNVKN